MLGLLGCYGEASVADHRSDRGHGGSEVLNHGCVLVAACGPCNGRKTHLKTHERLELLDRGLIVPKAATNEKTLARCAQIPVLDLQGDDWFLIDEHTRVHVNDAQRGRY